MFLPLFPLPFSPTSIVAQFKCSIESCLVIATIIVCASQCLIRKVCQRNEIPSANRGWIKTQFMSNTIDCSLQYVRRLGSACSPISGSRNFIGKYSHNLAIYCLYLVWSIEHKRCSVRNHRCCRGQECTHISNRTYFNSQQ